MDDFDSDINQDSNYTQQRDDTDLTGMDEQAAVQYVLAFVSTLKETETKIASLNNELKSWQERVAFAKQRTRDDLALAAEQRVKEIQEKIDALVNEERELAAKVKILMENLKKIKAGFTFSVDADRLSAELSMIVGEKDVVADQFKEEEALSELERLKQKMRDEKNI